MTPSKGKGVGRLWRVADPLRAKRDVSRVASLSLHLLARHCKGAVLLTCALAVTNFARAEEEAAGPAAGGGGASSADIQALKDQLAKQAKEIEDLKKQVAAMKPPAPTKPGPPAEAGAPTQTHKDLFRNGFHAKIYGFLRGDYESDTSRMSADPQLPFFVLSPVSTGGVKRGDSTFHARLTRVGIDLTAPETSILKGWKPTSKLEVDFFNAVFGSPNPAGGVPTARQDLVSNSRSAPRIRHAFLKLQNGYFHVLGGQTWDVISPLFPSLNSDTVMWNAGNTADRRPQIRIGYEPPAGAGKLSLVLMAGATGAVDQLDQDNNGIRDGDDRGVPTFQGRLGYTMPSWVKGSDLGFGIYGHRAERRLQLTAPGGKNDFESYLVGLDLALPLTNRFKLQGELWTGQDLADVRGGIGQTFNAATGREIAATGGWSELSYKTGRLYTVNVGYTFDRPQTSLVPVGGRTLNRTLYLTNRFSLGSGVEAGFDLANWATHFKGTTAGQNNRMTMYIQHNF